MSAELSESRILAWCKQKLTFSIDDLIFKTNAFNIHTTIDHTNLQLSAASMLKILRCLDLLLAAPQAIHGFEQCAHRLPDTEGRTTKNTSSPAETRPKDPNYLASGFYDALERPISEEQFWHQVDFEQKHGVPYIRDRESERRRLRLPLSISTFSTQQCEGERTQHVTERGICYKSAAGRSYRVDSLPSDCELTTYVDGHCTQDPFPCNDGIGDPKGCFITDAFESLKVTTREMPA